MYPDAKFIHIVRDPRKTYPSTLRLWQTLDQAQSMQRPTDIDKLKEFVLGALPAMYESFEHDRQGMKESEIFDVRYEDLIREPVAILERIYRQLGLGDFEPVRAKLEEKTQAEREYRPNRLELSAEDEAMVLQSWGDYAKRYGYV
jgi:hypothetical protein